MQTLPTGTVTFLMTDIQGSTRLWERHPQAMRETLGRHDAIAAEIIGKHGGTLIKSRGEGDSLFAVFQEAAAALTAACELQRAFTSESWPAETPLQVRMALHTGEVEAWAGDYYGPEVNRCARLRDITRPGQILLSQKTYEMVREGAGPVGFRRLGKYLLRDLRRPERVFQLLHPQLPSHFSRPPAPSLLPDGLLFPWIYFFHPQQWLRIKDWFLHPEDSLRLLAGVLHPRNLLGIPRWFFRWAFRGLTWVLGGVLSFVGGLLVLIGLVLLVAGALSLTGMGMMVGVPLGILVGMVWLLRYGLRALRPVGPQPTASEGEPLSAWDSDQALEPPAAQPRLWEEVTEEGKVTVSARESGEENG